MRNLFSMKFRMAKVTKPKNLEWILVSIVMVGFEFCMKRAAVALGRFFYFPVADSKTKLNSGFLLHRFRLFRISQDVPC